MGYQIDLNAVGEHLEATGLWDKPIRQFETHEIRGLCEAVLEAGNNDNAATPPYIDASGCLHIPFNAPKKYRWWQQGGQSVLDTLEELGANKAIKAKYTPTGYKEGISID